eukprot:scaffold25932_cov107-Isochrysis_galbana.AAC.3
MQQDEGRRTLATAAQPSYRWCTRLLRPAPCAHGHMHGSPMQPIGPARTLRPVYGSTQEQYLTAVVVPCPRHAVPVAVGAWQQTADSRQ